MGQLTMTVSLNTAFGGTIPSRAHTVIGDCRGEGLLPADSVEKQRVAGAESDGWNGAQAPFLSGFLRFLRRGKDLGQFAEVLGGGGEEEFIVRATWAAQSEASQA